MYPEKQCRQSSRQSKGNNPGNKHEKTAEARHKNQANRPIINQKHSLIKNS